MEAQLSQYSIPEWVGKIDENGILPAKKQGYTLSVLFKKQWYGLKPTDNWLYSFEYQKLVNKKLKICEIQVCL